jgi:hypothetical protein
METHSGGSTATCGSRLCERAMKARQLIDDASYGPEAVKALGQAFDEAWVNIAGNFGDDPSDIEEARFRLATALLSVASEDSRDVEVLKKAALEIMALNYRRRDDPSKP